MLDVRKDFPILENIVYLDSAATSQKPLQVIEAVDRFYRERNSNVARGLYSLAEDATMAYEEVRSKTQKFINAGKKEEIIFTKNTTEGANAIISK